MLSVLAPVTAVLGPMVAGATIMFALSRRLNWSPGGIDVSAFPIAGRSFPYRRWIRDLGRLLPELIVETDARGIIRLVNGGAATANGAGRGLPLEGTAITQLVHPAQRAAFAALLSEAGRAKDPATGEFDLVLAGREKAPARVVAALIDANSRPGGRGLRCVFTDLSSERRSRARLDHQRNASATITNILRTISSATEGEMDATLAQALVAVGGLATIDRCFLGRLADDGTSLQWEFSWAADGIEPVATSQLPATLSALPWLQEQVAAGRIVHIEDVAAMPPAAVAEKERLLRQETRSALIIPMFHDGRVAGLFAFHSVRSVGHWTDQDVDLLETVGQILAHAWQRRQADQERAAAHRRLADTIEFLPDATFVVDAGGHIVAWNRALEELTGRGKGDMLGRGDLAYAAALDGDPGLDPVAVILGRARRGEPMPGREAGGGGEPLRAERRLPRAFGGRGAHVWLVASPLRDADGRVVGAIESLRDVSEYKRTLEALRGSEERVRLLNEHLERRVDEATTNLRAANEALRDSETRYRRIIESLGDRFIFYSHDPDLRFSFVSPSYQRLTGAMSSDALRTRLTEWLELPVNAEARNRLRQMLGGYRPAPFELTVPVRGGEARILEIHAAPVLGPGGAVALVEGVARDVTDDRRNARLVSEAHVALLEAEKMAALGAMVAGMAHEMATPVGIGVTATSHLADLCQEGRLGLRQGHLTRSGLESLLGSMEQAAAAVQVNLGRAADLIQNFKQVAVDQSRSQERDFDLAEYLDEIVLSLRPRFKGTAHRLQVDCPPGIILHGDPGALYRVVVNLVMNSLVHGFEEMLAGTINLRVRRAGTGIVVEYHDDGRGLTREQQQRLYEPFYTTRRHRGGTGLGMHIVWNNVKHALGGSISCASAPGKGAGFTITLPQAGEARDVGRAG